MTKWQLSFKTLLGHAWTVKMRRRTIFAAKFLVGNYKTSSREQRGSGRMLVCKDYALTPKRERPFETERAGEGVQDPKAMHFVADVSINDVEVLESATCNFFFNILLEKPWKFKAVRRQRAKQTPSGFLTRVTLGWPWQPISHMLQEGRPINFLVTKNMSSKARVD